MDLIYPPPPFLISLGQVDSLLLWAVFCFSLLPPFSKDSDASGLDPTLSINQFKSNKCGILSRMVCIPLVWKAVLSCSMSVRLVFFFSHMGIWMFLPAILHPPPPPPLFIQASIHTVLPCISYLSTFQTRLCATHSRIPVSAQPTIHTISQWASTIFRMSLLVSKKRKVLFQNYWLLFVA